MLGSALYSPIEQYLLFDPDAMGYTHTLRSTIPGEKAWVKAMGASMFSFKQFSQSFMSPVGMLHVK